MSGPAQGVDERTGHVRLRECGAGSTPSLATSRLMSAGSCSGVISTSSCWKSSSHRSEPTGFSGACPAAGGSAAAMDAEVIDPASTPTSV